MKFRSQSLSRIPPYKFAELQKKKIKMQKKGVDVIDLGVGDPDLPTPDHIVNKLIEELRNPLNLKYPSFEGSLEFRKAVADFYFRTYHVELDPVTEVHALIGSKEGIFHFIPSIIDPGDYVLIPDPSYPIYRTATLLSNGEYWDMPLKIENNFQPEYAEIPTHIVKQAKIMILNYPSNPTAATVDIDFYEKTMDFARENEIVVANDSAYNQVTFGDYKSPSILQVDGAKEFAVEFGSFSKTYSMTGFRIGYVVGNKEVIRSLSAYKNNIDSGVFLPIQKAAIHALTSDQNCIVENNLVYEKRMKSMIIALQSIGIEVKHTKASLFIWAPVPKGYTSDEFVGEVLEKTGVIFTPGNAFGPNGEGYFRISLTVSSEKLDEAISRIKRKLSFY